MRETGDDRMVSLVVELRCETGVRWGAAGSTATTAKNVLEPRAQNFLVGRSVALSLIGQRLQAIVESKSLGSLPPQFLSFGMSTLQYSVPP